MKEKIEIDGMDLWCPEFYDIAKVLEMGAKKYGPRDWEINGTRMSKEENSDHMFHHLSAYRSGEKEDHESKLHPLLHLATRALMGYTREKREEKIDKNMERLEHLVDNFK